MANAIETRIHNVVAVLSAIQKQPGIAKPQIGKICGLAPSTVQNIVARLQECEAVLCRGELDSTGGRKAQRLFINPNHKYILAVSIHFQAAEIGMFNLEMELLRHQSCPLPLRELGPERYVVQLGACINAFLAEAGIPKSSFAGIGIGIPGPSDPTAGTVLRIPGISLWSDFPLGKRVAQATGLPVYVDKDTYLGVQYLDYSRQLKEGGTAVYLAVSEGIGAALIIDGTVFRGSHSLAGEIGHVTVRRDGAPCHCGNTGCLELYCSNDGIVSQYNAQASRSCQDIHQVVQKAAEGDETAQKVFVQALRYLVETISNIMMNYDPDEIVIQCNWLRDQQHLFVALLDNIYAKNIFTRKHTVEVRPLYQEQFSLHAAASIVGSRYLTGRDSPLIAETVGT